ncbi:MAG: response regulator transcription factor [Oscillospiraceae bacterium]
MAHILVAEDEIPINELISRNLKLVGHTAVQVYDGAAALSAIDEGQFDLLLLDIMLPKLSGLEVLRSISTHVPAIFVTAKGSLSDRLEGLGLGADDYIMKPFEILELLARVEAVLRRTSANIAVFELAGTRVEMNTRRVIRDNEEIPLTPQEFELLQALVLNRNLALSREKLLELAWGYDYEGDTRTVDVHVQKLRRKLCWENEIQTVYKLGYRLQTKR